MVYTRRRKKKNVYCDPCLEKVGRNKNTNSVKLSNLQNVELVQNIVNGLKSNNRNTTIPNKPCERNEKENEPEQTVTNANVSTKSVEETIPVQTARLANTHISTKSIRIQSVCIPVARPPHVENHHHRRQPMNYNSRYADESWSIQQNYYHRSSFPHRRAGIDYGGTKHLTTIHPPSSSSMPVHPDVRFKHLPFYDLLAELMKPTSLVPKSNNRFQESFFVFHLTPQQAQDIAMSRDFRPGAKCEYTVQVQLRFCLLETSCEQADNFPPSICVRVNGKMAPLPNPIPTTKPGIEPKRPGRAIDITSLCRLSPTISNHLDVSWASEFGRNPIPKKKLPGRALDITHLLKLNPNMSNEIHVSWSSEEAMVGYCLAVFLVRRLTSDILLQRLKQFGNRHPDHTRALIKEKLAHDPDSEIATTSLRVSLMCPLGKMRLQIPCRASTCTHLQCYDANTFLMMNEKKATWICPVCDKPASFDKLIIDGYFLEIFRASPNCNDIQFHPDGNWSRLETPKETHVISSPVVLKSETTSSPTSSAVKIQPPETTSKGGGDDVIDLTLDSSEDEDDDDDPPPKSVSDKGCVSPGIINLDTPTPPHAGSTQSVSSSPNSTPSLDLHHSPNRLSPLFTPNSTPPPAHTKPSLPFAATSLTNHFAPYPLPPLVPSSSLPVTPMPLPSMSPLDVDPTPSTSELFPPGTENLTDNEFEKFLNNLNWY